MVTEAIATDERGVLKIDSALLDGFLCPVCGYVLPAPPADFLICPSCGTEFGNDDLDWSHDQLRDAWLDKGANWWSNSQTPPADWNPIAQVLWVVRLGGSGDPKDNSINDNTDLANVGNGDVWATWKTTAPTEG